jgi:hypothetical protein
VSNPKSGHARSATWQRRQGDDDAEERMSRPTCWGRLTNAPHEKRTHTHTHAPPLPPIPIPSIQSATVVGVVAVASLSSFEPIFLSPFALVPLNKTRLLAFLFYLCM